MQPVGRIHLSQFFLQLVKVGVQYGSSYFNSCFNHHSSSPSTAAIFLGGGVEAFNFLQKSQIVFVPPGKNLPCLNRLFYRAIRFLLMQAALETAFLDPRQKIREEIGYLIRGDKIKI